jgi:hypothetical protein
MTMTRLFWFCGWRLMTDSFTSRNAALAYARVLGAEAVSFPPIALAWCGVSLTTLALLLWRMA